MTYFKSLPKTTFLLPNGSSIDSTNILKSIVFSDTFLESKTQIRKKYYDHVKRIENVSYREYRENMSFYWLLVNMNKIDSFSKVPMSQSMFEQNYLNQYDGKIYYSAKGEDHSAKILPGDMILRIDSVDRWKYGGIVKEYDSIFRRIILDKEYENTDNSNAVTSGIQVFRLINNETWELKYTLNIGRVENESDRILKVYRTQQQKEVSLYSVVNEVSGIYEPTGEHDFQTVPTDPTLLFRISGTDSTLAGYRYYTKFEDELAKNASYKNLKFTSTNTAFRLNAALSNLTTNAFTRGQKLKVES